MHYSQFYEDVRGELLNRGVCEQEIDDLRDDIDEAADDIPGSLYENGVSVSDIVDSMIEEEYIILNNQEEDTEYETEE